MTQPLESTSGANESSPNLIDSPGKGRLLPAFLGGQRLFSLGDILDAAEWRGDLAEFRLAWIARQACVVAAEQMEQVPAPDDVEAAVDAFRYARDLVSAEECERWLGQRGLTFADLTGSVSRRLQAELAEAEAEPDLTPEDDLIFVTDALLSDEFTGWAQRLARRVALALEAGIEFPETATLNSLWPSMEERTAVMVAELTTPERRRRALAAQRLPLMRVTIEVAEFDSEDAAREARLCSCEDGVRLSDTASANGFACRKIELFLDELPADWQQALISARPGDVVSPPLEAGCIRMIHLLGRREPSLDDERVRERVDSGLVQQHLRELETRHIRWQISVEVEA